MLKTIKFKFKKVKMSSGNLNKSSGSSSIESATQVYSVIDEEEILEILNQPIKKTRSKGQKYNFAQNFSNNKLATTWTNKSNWKYEF